MKAAAPMQSAQRFPFGLLSDRIAHADRNHPQDNRHHPKIERYREDHVAISRNGEQNIHGRKSTIDSPQDRKGLAHSAALSLFKWMPAMWACVCSTRHLTITNVALLQNRHFKSLPNILRRPYWLRLEHNSIAKKVRCEAAAFVPLFARMAAPHQAIRMESQLLGDHL